LIFVDTGAFLALYRKRDQYYRQAAETWSKLDAPLLTSSHITAELATLLARQVGWTETVDRVADVYASPNIDVIGSAREDELEALRWMRKLADQRVSFTDCVSFALMRRHRIRTAFTFDRHFRLAGFQVVGLK
jgi:predicted nucleic acid-binding protein